MLDDGVSWKESRDMRRGARPTELTFLHVKDTFGLCTAYFVTTSKILAYSSEVDRSAASRVGVL